MADPITLTFTGTATGTLGVTSFTNAIFTVTSIGNTGDTFVTSGPTYQLPVSTSTISISGLPAATFTDSTGWADPQGTGEVIFDDSNLGTDLLGITALLAGLETYQFSASLGPVSGFDFEPNIFENFENIPTTQGLLTISRTSNDLTFNADVTTNGSVTTPEPATAWLLGVAIFIGAMLPRRVRRRWFYPSAVR